MVNQTSPEQQAFKARQTVPVIDAAGLAARHPDALAATRLGAEKIGFLILENTGISRADVEGLLAAYAGFFKAPEAVKANVDMARTGANRGWGRPGAEQVDPEANPDYKEVFDCGIEVPPGDPRSALTVYGRNHWPEGAGVPAGFRSTVETYLSRAREVAHDLLLGIATAIGRDPGLFATAFDAPMALLRGNFYPARPDWAGAKDFGIAPHSDYGCLTLLATDGQPGLEAQLRDGTWVPVQAAPGAFVINFGEMLEIWTQGAVRATPHRVIGGASERISVPLFFNPSYDTNVAPVGAAPVSAGDYLSRRYQETYVHLQEKA